MITCIQVYSYIWLKNFKSFCTQKKIRQTNGVPGQTIEKLRGRWLYRTRLGYGEDTLQ